MHRLCLVDVLLIDFLIRLAGNPGTSARIRGGYLPGLNFIGSSCQAETRKEEVEKMRTPMATALSLRVLLFVMALIFTAGVMASPAPDREMQNLKVVSRQVAATTPAVGTVLEPAQACQQYSKVANFSAIGSNATIRSAFLEASPVGTMFNSAMLNVMQANAMNLSKDVQLNQVCGNLTAVALEQVNVNFTMGIVGQFMFMENPVSVINGPIIIAVTAVCLLLILGPASAV